MIGLESSASVWIWPLAAMAATGAVASVILLRDHLRLERQAAELAAELAALRGGNRRASGRGETPGPGCSPIFPARAQADSLRAPFGGEGWTDNELRRSARTALGGMMGLTSLLLDTPLDRDQALLIERVRELGRQVLACLEGRPLPRPAGPDEGGGGAGRVLLVEDNEVNALLALRSLEKAGAAVDWVRDGSEAMAAVRQSFAGQAPAYDLVLMDLRMPGVDGLEAARQIRALEEALQRPVPLRIVALTATTMRQDRAAARAAGIDEFLSKPYRAEALTRLLGPAADRMLAPS